MKTRDKFPFVEQQSCDNCVDKINSPTEKLNEIYAEFAEKKYPALYNLIKSESKKEIKKYAQVVKEIGEFQEEKKRSF